MNGYFGEDMLVEAGLVALCVALAGLFSPVSSGFNLRLVRLGSKVTALLLLASFLALVAAHVQSDFAFQNVYQNSHTDKPLFYKIAGVWGNHEGSILLWTLIAALYGAALAFKAGKQNALLMLRALGVQALLVAGFCGYVFFVSNPFIHLVPAPTQGLGLNPLLQDPALAIHPPVLYAGYVGFSIVFSLAIAALLTRIEGKETFALLRRWLLAPWALLTCGIALGSWWAYYELGWGGWWFWDPVENASFIPWLSGTALLHAVIVAEKRGNLKAWTMLLALLTFTFCLSGTFLVRSGIITSVHAFALDPTRGIYILALIGLVAGGGLLVFALRAHDLNPENEFAPLSRETLISLNTVFMFAGCLTVLVGTLYPLLAQLLAGLELSVGAPYYEDSFVPLMMPLMVLMGLSPTLAWNKDELKRLAPSLQHAGLITLALLLLVWFADNERAFRFYLGLAFVAWIGATTILQALRAKKISPMTLAHLGFAITLMGMVVESHLSHDRIMQMRIGEDLRLDDRVFHFENITRVEGPNYTAERAKFTLNNGMVMYPERRFYPLAQKILSDVAINTNGFRDIYLVLGEAQKDDDGNMLGWSVHAHVNMLAPWIWLGCLVMAAGGLLRLFRKNT